MKNVRLYARVSTAEQKKKDLSVPAQLDALNKYCIENKYNVVGVYHDDGVSAATIKKRKDFCRMLNDLQKDDIILFTKLDRMSRDLLDGNMLLKQFAPLNVTFKAIFEEDIDVTTADGKFMFDLKVSLAERERKVDSERILVSFEYKLSRGEPLGGRLPVGYRKENKKAIIDESKVDFIKDCFNTIELEMNTFKSMRILNARWELKHDRKYYMRLWRKTQYIGVYKGLDNIFPQIIDKIQFDNVQTILDGRYYKITPSGRSYYFTGLLVCTTCGKKLGATTTSGNNNKYKFKMYRCTNITTGEKTHCCYSEKKLEKRILNLIVPLFEDKIFNLQVQEKKVNQNKDLIKSSKLKLARIQELYIDGKLDKNTFDKKYDALTETIKNEEQKNDIVIIQSNKEKYQDLLDKDLLTLYSSFDDQGKRKFWRSFIKEIIVNSYDDIRIILL